MQNYQLSEIHVHFVFEFSNCDSLLHLDQIKSRQKLFLTQHI